MDTLDMCLYDQYFLFSVHPLDQMNSKKYEEAIVYLSFTALLQFSQIHFRQSKSQST